MKIIVKKKKAKESVKKAERKCETENMRKEKRMAA
jgi:hypothetical protein